VVASPYPCGVSAESATTRSGVAREGLYREPGVEIAPGVHAMGPSTHGQNQGGYSRAYLFDDGDDLTLVDTLWDEDAHMILEYLWSIGRTPRDIKHIVMTHAHRSHLGGLATLKALSGAKVYSHAEEAPIIEGHRQAAKIPLTPLLPVQLIPIRVASQLGLYPHVHCTVDEKITEGSEVGSLKILHMPGHTCGNVTLSWQGARVLAVADIIMQWPSFSAGWPGFNTDEDQFRESLERVVELQPEVVCTGHGDPIWKNANRIANLLR
jgi:glyoxylase-like metal-dependent hydrolase (beta-lactamase superfamily II)